MKQVLLEMLVIFNGIDPTFESKSGTPLQIATKVGKADVIDLLQSKYLGCGSFSEITTDEKLVKLASTYTAFQGTEGVTEAAPFTRDGTLL
jgi:hypothetical protein